MTAGGQFERVIEKMPELLNRLQSSPALSRDSLGGIPQRGVYAFNENGASIYVGRSNRLRQRLLEHGRRSSLHNSATFAFILATYEARERGLDFPPMPRTLLQNYPGFRGFSRRRRTAFAECKFALLRSSTPLSRPYLRCMPRWC
jgi:hypothetical protein